MDTHRATVNLPGLPFGATAEVSDAEAERWVAAGYLDPIRPAQTSDRADDDEAGDEKPAKRSRR